LDECLRVVLRAEQGDQPPGSKVLNGADEQRRIIVRLVQRGQRLRAPELVHHVLDEYRRLAQERLRQEAGLSEQEIEVLRLLADGATSREIADRLFWSEVTVKRKIQDIADKLHAGSRIQAVAEAVRRGLI
jgi:DNA-binding NarL/FixJ family response regulator